MVAVGTEVRAGGWPVKVSKHSGQSRPKVHPEPRRLRVAMETLATGPAQPQR